jgi:ribosomal protein L29
LERRQLAFDDKWKQRQAKVAELRAELAEAKAQLARLKAIDSAVRAERDITQPLS